MDSQVDAAVNDQPTAAGEGLQADIAGDPFSGVKPRVDGKGPRIYKRFLAVFALEWSFTCVPPSVNYQMGRPRKDLGAEFTLIWSILALVLVQMSLKIFGTSKGFTAHVALVVQRRRRCRRAGTSNPTATTSRRRVATAARAGDRFQCVC